MKIDESEIRTFAFKTIRARELKELLNSWKNNSDPLRFVNEALRYLEKKLIMFLNDLDDGADETFPGPVPSILNFAEILNIFDEILSTQQELVKQEIDSSRKDPEILAKAENLHFRILQASAFMIRGFTEYCACDWGRFPIMDKLVAFLDYLYSAEYFIELMQLVLTLFRISQGQFMNLTVQQLLSLYSSALDHLDKENYDVNQLIDTFRDLSEEKLLKIMASIIKETLPTDLDDKHILEVFREEIPLLRVQKSTPFELKKKLLKRLQLSGEYDLYVNGRASKLKFLGVIQLFYFWNHPDLYDELKIHFHLQAYLCREIFLREVRREDREGEFSDFADFYIDSRENLKQFRTELIANLVDALDRASGKAPGINLLTAAYNLECLLLLYIGYQKQEFGAISNDNKSGDSLLNTIEEFGSKFFRPNEYGSFLEIELLKRFLFIFNQIPGNPDSRSNSVRLSSLHAIQLLISFVEFGLERMQTVDVVAKVTQLIGLIDSKFFESEKYSALEKATGSADYACVLFRCSNLFRACTQRQEIGENKEFRSFRIKEIERFIRRLHLNFKVLNDELAFPKDHIIEILRAQTRYLCVEFSYLLSTDQKDLAKKIFSWINIEKMLETVEFLNSSLKKTNPTNESSSAVLLEILLFLLHAHRICQAHTREQLLKKENMKIVLLFSVEVCRVNPANFYLIMNCLSSMAESLNDIQQVCYEIGFADFFIQNIGFTETLFDHIATSCSYELYKPPKDIPTLPPLRWQADSVSINDTINFKIWTEILFPYKTDWRRVLKTILDMLERANIQIKDRIRHICELIANRAQPDLIERANRVFTSEFQKYGHLIFKALTNCETLELDSINEEAKEFSIEFGKMATEALKLFFSISLTLLRFEKEDVDLCKERQGMVELTASFMNLKRVKPFVDEFIANFWQEHMIDPIKKFDDENMKTLAIVLTKIAKISEISPQFKETHRKDLFHTITLYLIKSKQLGLEKDNEIVLFEGIEEIEMVVWLMKLLSLINSCGNSNISGTNSTVRGVEDRVRKQLSDNLKLVERFVISIVRQRITRSQDKHDESRHTTAFYETLDRLARCLIFGPYFLKTPRGLLNQHQIDGLIESFAKCVEELHDPKKDKEKVIQAIFERTVLETALLGLFSNIRKNIISANDPQAPDHLKNEKYIRIHISAGSNILFYLINLKERSWRHDIIISEFLNIFFERKILADIIDFFRAPEVFKYNSSVEEYIETLKAMLDVQVLIQQIDLNAMAQYKNRAFNSLLGDLMLVPLQFIKCNVSPLLAKTRNRWVDMHLAEKKVSIPELVEKISTLVKEKLNLKALFEFLRNFRIIEGGSDAKEIILSWFGIVQAIHPEVIWQHFVIPELFALNSIFSELLKKQSDQLELMEAKYLIPLGNDNILEDFLYFVIIVSGRFRNICYLESNPETHEIANLVKNLRVNYVNLVRRVIFVFDCADQKLKDALQKTFFADYRLRESLKEYLSFKKVFGIVADYLRSIRDEKDSLQRRNQIITEMEKIVFASIQKNSLVNLFHGPSYSYSEEIRMISLMMESFPHCRDLFFEKIFLDPEKMQIIKLENLADEFFHILDIITRDPFDPKFSLDLSFSCNSRKSTINPEAILFSITKKASFFLQHHDFSESMKRYIAPDPQHEGKLSRNSDCKLYAFELESIRELVEVHCPLFKKVVEMVKSLLEKITDKDKLFNWIGVITYLLMKNPILLLEFSLMEYLLLEVISKSDFNLGLNILRAVLTKNSANFLVKYKNKLLRNDECARVLLLEKIVDRILQIFSLENPNNLGILTEIITMQLRLIDIIIREFNPWWEEETQLSSEALQKLFLATEKLILNENVTSTVKKRILQEILIFQKVWFQVYTRIAIEDVFRLGLNRETEQKLLYVLKSSILNTKFYENCRKYSLERKPLSAEYDRLVLLAMAKAPMVNSLDVESQKLNSCINFYSHFACQIELYKNQQSAALTVNPVRGLYSFFAKTTEDLKDGFNYMVDCSVAPKATKTDLTLEKARKKLFEIIGCKDDEDERKNADRNRISQLKKKISRKSEESGRENLAIQLNALQTKSLDQLWIDVIKSEEFVRAVKDVQLVYRKCMEQHGIEDFNKMLIEKKYDHILYRKLLQPMFDKFVNDLDHLHKIAFYSFLDRETIYRFEDETEMRIALFIKERFADLHFDTFSNIMKNLSLIIKAREEEEEKRLRSSFGLLKLSKIIAPNYGSNMNHLEEEKYAGEQSPGGVLGDDKFESQVLEHEKKKKLEPLSPTRVATTELKAEKILSLLRNEVQEDELEIREEPQNSNITKVKIFSYIFSAADLSEPGLFKFVLDYEPSFRPQTNFFQVYSNESLLKYTDPRRLEICEEYLNNLYKDKPNELYDVFLNSLPSFSAVSLEKMVLILLAFPKWRTSEIEEYKEMLFEICINPVNEIRILDFAYVLAQLKYTDPEVRVFFEEYYGITVKLVDFEDRFNELLTRLFENVEFLAKINKQSSLFISDLSTVNLKIEEKYGRIALKDRLAKRFNIRTDDINVLILQIFAAVHNEKVMKSLVSIAFETMINNKNYRSTIIEEPKISKYFKDMSHDIQFRDRVSKIIHDQCDEFAEDLSLLVFLLRNCGFIEAKIKDLEECNAILENTLEFFEVMHDPEHYGNKWQLALVDALKKTIQESTLSALSSFSIFERNLITIIEKIIERIHDSRGYSTKNLLVLKEVLKDLDQLVSNENLQKIYVCIVQLLEILEKLLDKFGSDLILKQMFYDAYVSYEETKSLIDFIVYTYEMTNIKTILTETLEDIELKLSTQEEVELEEERKLSQTKWVFTRIKSKDKDMHLPSMKKTLTELMASGVLPIDEAIMRLSQTGRKIISSIFMTNYLNQNQAEEVDCINRAPWLFDLDTKRQVFKRVIQSDTLDDSEVHKIAFVIDRERILEHTIYNFDRLHSEIINRKLKIYIKFVGEEGVDGGGLTNEWLSLLTQELLDPKKALFQICANQTSLQPSSYAIVIPNSQRYFRLAGRLIGYGLCHNLSIEIPFARPFLKQIAGHQTSVSDLNDIDPELFNSLRWMTENIIDNVLAQDFAYEISAFGEYHTIEIGEGENQREVTDHNKKTFVKKLAFSKLQKEIEEPLREFRKGIFEFVPEKMLKIFLPSELDSIFAGKGEIDVNEMMQFAKVASGLSDKLIKRFWAILQEFDQETLSTLLFFITGKSKVGIGGFKEHPISLEVGSDNLESLPVAHTCASAIDLPNYPTKEILKSKLLTAIYECKGFGFA